MIEWQKFRYLKFRNVNKVEFIMTQSLIFIGLMFKSAFRVSLTV